jgi:P27 family predicted phage terminase small subunit
MARPGKAPTPTAILAARGSWRAKLNPAEPLPELGAPDCPAHLSDAAKEIWYQIVPRLLAMGVLSRVDGNALARYCDAFIQWRRAAEFLNAHELVYPMKGKDGKVSALAPYPQNALYDRYARILSGLEAQFGLTPAARTRIAAATEAKGPQDTARLRQLLPNRAG